MIPNRNSRPVPSFWGIDTQPQRLGVTVNYAKIGDHILDLGSGRGAYTHALSQMGLFVIGFDVNLYPEWITSSKDNFVVGTGTKLPFRDKAFDITIAFEVLEHIPDLVQALREIARCTKKYLIFSVPNCDLNNNLRKYDLALAHWTDTTHCNFFTKETLASFLSDHDFEVVDMMNCYRISPNDYYWDNIKLPHLLTKIPKFIINKFKLAEFYWSSILVVAIVPVE